MRAYRCPSLSLALFLWVSGCFPLPVRAGPGRPAPSSQPLSVFLIDQLPPQGIGPAFNGLDERRRGPLFEGALQRVVRDGKLPPLKIINPDLSLIDTLASEPKVPAGATLVRIYLTQWERTRLGGPAENEIFCRFFAEIVHDGRVTQKLGPFFARQRFDQSAADTAQQHWSQYQAVAAKAMAQLGTKLP